MADITSSTKEALNTCACSRDRKDIPCDRCERGKLPLVLTPEMAWIDCAALYSND